MNTDSILTLRRSTSGSNTSSRATTVPSTLDTTTLSRSPLKVRRGERKKLTTSRYSTPDMLENTIGITAGRMNIHADRLMTIIISNNTSRMLVPSR